MGISAESLNPNQTIVVRGKLSFSRLARLIEGDALTKRIAEQKKRGSLYPTDKPHTTISIIDAVVEFADPANPTREEQYVQQEKLYTSKSGENQGKVGFNIDNKSNSLPQVFEKNEDGSGYHQVVLANDLASGLDVSLVLNTYASGDYAKRGIGLQQVFVHEPLKYFGGAVNRNALAARGLVITGDVKLVAGADSPAAETAYEDEGDASVPANTVIGESGFAGPAPAIRQAAPAAAPAVAEETELEALRRKLAESEARANAAQANDASPFGAVSGGIQYQG